MFANCFLLVASFRLNMNTCACKIVGVRYYLCSAPNYFLCLISFEFVLNVTSDYEFHSLFYDLVNDVFPFTIKQDVLSQSVCFLE